MYILDLIESDGADLLGYRSEKEDNSVMKLSDIRKTRLTLAHLHTLRMAADIRKFENEQKLETVQKQYATPADAGGGMMPGM